jgi:UDP-N-acetylglucosamine 4,6-dehydratase
VTETYLVTGATGFLGSEITRHLLSQGHKVRAFARNEHGHEKLIQSIPEDQRSRLSSLLGAVEDDRRLHRALRGVNHVIHAAAQKVVPIAEYDPGSCLSTNVGGTRNVAEACLDAGVRRAVFVSTDKASSPATLYGASKLCAERVWLGSNRYSAGVGCEFTAVRYGNVWASKGSVLEAWAGSKGKLKITDPQCTRFHIHRHEAVAFVLDALAHAHPGELWIPKLPTYRIGNLCLAFRRAFNIPEQPEHVGLRLAEKLHEDLISPHESIACKSKEEHHYVLEPGRIHEQGGWGYSSGMPGHQLSVEELTREVELWKGRHA